MNLHELLSGDSPVISDGAWGTELATRGLGTDVPEAWNLTHPDEVASIAAAYAAAGSQIVLTNTFGGNHVKLGKCGIAEHDEVNRQGAALSSQGAGDMVVVLASVGPTGELVGLTSTLSESEIEDAFAAQAEALVQGGVDGFVIETMADLTEARCALRAIKRVSALPVVASMTFDQGVRGPASMMGITPGQAASELTACGADLIGANCGRLGDDDWQAVVEALAAATDRPIWAKANAGLPELIGGKSVFSMTPDMFAKLGVGLAGAGARVVGGCCGTTPAHIAALSAALK